MGGAFAKLAASATGLRIDQQLLKCDPDEAEPRARSVLVKRARHMAVTVRCDDCIVRLFGARP